MTTMCTPAGAGPATPENDKGQQVTLPALDPTAQEIQHGHSANPAAGADTEKAWRNAQAQCALAGFRADLIDGDNGRPQLIVSRWALTRSFATPAEAAAWLDRVTGTRE